jgi:sulfite exporter TauE/SafE
VIAFAAGLLLGVSGSAHCAAMCGPLVAVADGAAARKTGPGRGSSRWRGRAMYHGGRLGVYALLGAAAGASGGAVEGRGFGRGLALAAGLALVAQACVAVGAGPGGIGTKASSRLAGVLARAAGWLRRHGLARPPVMGALNGLLPCGLVYAAVIAASGTGGVTAALSLMLGFGLGTLPALLGAGVVSRMAAARMGPGLRRVAVPVALGVAGMVLIARGLGPASHHDHVGLAAPAAVPALSTASGHAHH